MTRAFINKYLIVLSAILLWMHPAAAGDKPHGDAGTTGASFLKIGIGARPIGMGGAYTAISNDANSIYWNPAGLTTFSGGQLALMHNEWFQDINYEFLGLAYADSGYSGFAFSISYLWMDDITVTTFSDRLGTSGDTFTANDLSFVFGYAQHVNDFVSVGGSLKRIRSKLENEDASATAFDLGALIYTPVEGLTLGFTAQNIGSKLKFVQDGDSLPRVYKGGVGYRYRHSLTLAMDVSKPNDHFVRVNTGAEFVLFNTLALRAGYNTANELDDGFAGGAGVRMQKFAFDYAYVPYGVLGNTHRFSVIFKF